MPEFVFAPFGLSGLFPKLVRANPYLLFRRLGHWSASVARYAWRIARQANASCHDWFRIFQRFEKFKSFVQSRSSCGIRLACISSAMFKIRHFVLADQADHARPEPIGCVQRFRSMPLQFLGPAGARQLVHLTRM